MTTSTLTSSSILSAPRVISFTVKSRFNSLMKIHGSWPRCPIRIIIGLNSPKTGNALITPTTGFCGVMTCEIARATSYSSIRSRVGDRNGRATVSSSMLIRSEEHTSELQSLTNLVCRLLLEKKKNNNKIICQRNHVAHKTLHYEKHTNELRMYDIPMYTAR